MKWCFQFGLSSTGYHGNDQQDPRGRLQDSPWAELWISLLQKLDKKGEITKVVIGDVW